MDFIVLSKYKHADGLVQERRNSIATALELRLSCTNPSMYLTFISVVPKLQESCWLAVLGHIYYSLMWLEMDGDQVVVGSWSESGGG